MPLDVNRVVLRAWITRCQRAIAIEFVWVTILFSHFFVVVVVFFCFSSFFHLVCVSSILVSPYLAILVAVKCVEIFIQTIVHLAILIDIWTKLYLFTSRHSQTLNCLFWFTCLKYVRLRPPIAVVAAPLGSTVLNKQVIYTTTVCALQINCRCQFISFGIYLNFQRFSNVM